MDYNGVAIHSNNLPYTGAPDLVAWLVVALVVVLAGAMIRWAVTRP